MYIMYVMVISCIFFKSNKKPQTFPFYVEVRHFIYIYAIHIYVHYIYIC